MSAIALRAATACDATVLAALSSAVYLDTYAPDGVDDSIAREVQAVCGVERMQARLADRDVEVVLAMNGDRAVGLLELASATKCPVASIGGLEVLRLYVLPAWQRRGVGRALLDHAAQRGRQRGAPALWLTAWSGNTRALSFYAALGWADVGTTDYVWEDRVFENRVLVRALAG